MISRRNNTLLYFENIRTSLREAHYVLHACLLVNIYDCAGSMMMIITSPFGH
jgi:hypothetical protein